MTAAVTHQHTVETVSLACGATLHFQRLLGAPRLALNWYVYGGNRLEPLPGVADMVDDLLTEGTTTRSAEQIALDLDGLSLDLDTDTKRDTSVVSATLLEEDLDASLALIADLMGNSTLAEFEKEKVRLEGELLMDLDSPKTLSHDLLMTTLFAGSPYQASHQNILATLPQLRSVDPLMQTYRRRYQPANMLISAVGDISLARLVGALNAAFPAPASSGDCLADVDAPSPLALPASRVITGARDDSNQLHIYKAWFAPKLSDPDYAPMVVLNTILGAAGLSSRLFLELRDKQGLAYTVRSSYDAAKYLGLFVLYIGTEPNNRDKALKGFEVECQKLMDTPVGAEELSQAIENVIGRRVVYLETAPQQAAYLGAQLAAGLSLQALDELVPRIQAVTPADIQRVAQHVMGAPSLTSMVGPEKFVAGFDR